MIGSTKYLFVTANRNSVNRNVRDFSTSNPIKYFRGGR